MPSKPESKDLSALNRHRTRHLLFVNPYEDFAFTKCPKCEGKTRERKFPLFIHIKPDQPFVLNVTCRYCPGCDLVIVKESKVEALMAAQFSAHRPEMVGHDYLIVGTLEKADWRAREKLSPQQIVEQVLIFKDQLFFKITGGWTRE